MRLQLRALVVSDALKVCQKDRQVTMQKVTEREPLMRYRNIEDDVETELLYLVRDKLKGNLLTASATSGIEVARAA
jgi:hypothetical protein